MTAKLYVCETCAFSAEEKLRDGRTGGEILGALVAERAARSPEVEFVAHSCLMGCEHSCNVALQSLGKLSYVIGAFSPTEESAEAIVEFAEKYAASETGRVPYREWPQGVKGHFIARIPALPTG